MQRIYRKCYAKNEVNEGIYKMMNIDSYDWNELYKRAEEFCNKHIPNARVNTGVKSFVFGSPRVEISFLMKGNADYLKILDNMPCLRKLKGMNTKNGRVMRGEIIFNSDGYIN